MGLFLLFYFAKIPIVMATVGVQNFYVTQEGITHRLVEFLNSTIFEGLERAMNHILELNGRSMRHIRQINEIIQLCFRPDF